MTRLVAGDVADPTARLDRLERQLLELAGLDLMSLAQRAAGMESGGRLCAGVSAAAVPITTGQGLITGFCEMVVAVLTRLGCAARVTWRTDVPGIQEAVESGAELVFLADDARFVALNVRRGRCVDNDDATAAGYVTALEAAAGGLCGRRVLLLGCGPVGRAAGRCLRERGAELWVVEPDGERLAAALAELGPCRAADLKEGMAACDLVVDATPAPDIIGAGDIRAATIAAVPGIPSGFTAGAQAALGGRHIHDPLAIGVAAMAAVALRPPRRS